MNIVSKYILILQPATIKIKSKARNLKSVHLNLVHHVFVSAGAVDGGNDIIVVNFQGLL